MIRVDLLSAAPDVLTAAESIDAGSTFRLLLVLGGLALAVAAFRVASFLGSMLGAALQAVSALFSLVGRAVGVGVVGLAVAGLAVFGLGFGSDEAPEGAPPTTVELR